MKRVLITAGPVYGRLDDNKLVSNRVRGVWATKFAEFLLRRGHHVTLLIADIQTRLMGEILGESSAINVVTHTGFADYHLKCLEAARTHDAAVMAAAVVNWIPANPIAGKMATKGYKPGDIINVPFILAPRVIDEMKAQNPNLTLIGCKMLIGATEDELVEAAYGTLIGARCNVVVANDMGHGLRRKLLVYPDRSTHEYNDNFDEFFLTLLAVIEDEHYRTAHQKVDYAVYDPNGEGEDIFGNIIAKYRRRFTHRQAGSDRVFGAIFVPTRDIALGFATPREKGEMFTAEDAVVIEKIDGRTLHVTGREKATLNAPLLVRVSQKYPWAHAILHLHEQLPGVPTVPYAPPGTVRDNERVIPGPVFNIKGHGFIACLDSSLEIAQRAKWPGR